MIISHEPGMLKKLKRASWRFQGTFETPLADLERFVSVIISAQPDISGASLVFENLVFPPAHLASLQRTDSQAKAIELEPGMALVAETSETARRLLTAALSDWVDFYWVPTPKPFVIFADHDEYCTFYANTHSGLNSVCDLLGNSGFRRVGGFERGA